MFKMTPVSPVKRTLAVAVMTSLMAIGLTAPSAVAGPIATPVPLSCSYRLRLVGPDTQAIVDQVTGCPQSGSARVRARISYRPNGASSGSILNATPGVWAYNGLTSTSTRVINDHHYVAHWAERN